MVGRGDEEGEGRGGKLTRRSLRRAQPKSKPKPTPYDRPRSKTDGWLSRLVVQPAARMLPSIFSFDSSRIKQGEHDAAPILDSDNQVSQSKEAGSSAETVQPKVTSEFRELVVPELKDSYDGRGIVEIEQRLKQKMFSRDESKRLIEILRSRTTDISNDDGGAEGFTAEATGGALSQKLLISPATEKRAVNSDLNMTLKTSDPLPLSPHNEVGSSPVEIAKIYMQSLTSASDHDDHIGRPVVEKISLYNDESASKLSFPSAVNSPMRWPGAVVENNHGYFTPQTRIGRVGICTMPCTPYCGSVFQKSDSKSRDGGERPSIPPLAGWKQTSVVSSGKMAMKRRNSVLDDDLASVGSITRAHTNNVSRTTELAGSSNLGRKLLLTGSSDVLKDFPSHFPRYLEDSSLKAGMLKHHPADTDKKVSRFTIDSPSVHPQSSQMARRILKHLDLPSSREKLLVLDNVTSRTNTPPKALPIMVDCGSNIRDGSAANNHNRGCFVRRDVDSQQSLDTLKQAVNVEFLGKNQFPFLPSETGMQGILGSRNRTTDSEVFHIPKSVPHSSSKRPVYTSISSAKPSEKLKTTTEFTFCVPLASNASAEPPPTPTMSSTVAAASRIPGNNNGNLPSFSFSSSNANSDPVFSLKDITSSSLADKSTPKFNFESNKNCKTSFGMIGKDAICY